eukprot:scaffold10188_cov280-Chaetoceros_neogracile.AAC.3
MDYSLNAGSTLSHTRMILNPPPTIQDFPSSYMNENDSVVYINPAITIHSIQYCLHLESFISDREFWQKCDDGQQLNQLSQT